LAEHVLKVCILTPPGRGAVAVARVWGPGALPAVDAAFRPLRGEGLASTPPNRPRFGRLGAGMGDEVVAVVLEGDPPGVEVQCHGGSAAIAMVVAGLQEQGCRLVEPAEFLSASEPSSFRAAAWEDLAKATTLRTAEILLEQAQGALDRAMAAIEANPTESRRRLEDLIERAGVGLRLVSGWRVVIAGRPNAGKSRLLNALAGYDRAIVAATPGTTRDAVTVRTAFDGWPVELVDTAGVREAEDPVERSGVERALRERSRADLTLLLLDRSRPLEEDDRRPPSGPALIVASKADLPAAWEPAEVFGGRVPFVVVSAQTGEGLDELAEAVARLLVPGPPPPGVGVPFRPEHLERLLAMRSP